MDINDVLSVLWRRKLIVVAVTAAIVGAAVAALNLVSPVYESTSTIVVSPRGSEADFSFFYALESIVPIYANAATTQTTRSIAAEELDGPLASISVAAVRRTPIIRVTARDENPERARDSAQAVTDALLDQVEDGDVGIPSLQLVQIDRPLEASEPVFPRTTLTLLVASLLGIAAGLGAALTRERLTSRIESADDASEATGVPVFAEVPSVSAVKRLSSPEALALDTRYRDVFESLRDLRTNLQFTNGKVRSIAVTSPEGRHGKTTISFGLAVSLARTGARTLLVDGDLRRGRIAEMLAVPNGRGLLDVLQGAQPKSVIQRTSMEHLDLLTGGTPIHDPGELLQSRFPAVLERLLSTYDAVVIDTTPLVPVNDARIIASSVEATVLVASASSVTRSQLRTAVDRLKLISIRPTAIVLNNSKSSTGGYYG